MRLRAIEISVHLLEARDLDILILLILDELKLELE